jgi:formamidopyrimidine-DNA glycosylase
MPELPDITVYIESLEARIVGHTLSRIELKNPFLLRTVEPALDTCIGRKVTAVRRIGKRVAIQFEGDFWMALHLMIAGRLHWYASGRAKKIRPAFLYLYFDSGTLTLTEAGTKRRASLHVLASEASLHDLDRGGLEVLTADAPTFIARMRERNHTLKRALTDPSILSGIGNAYSDEILHRARLSPLLQVKHLDDEQLTQLLAAIKETLAEWMDKLRQDASGEFPEGVTAFREGMAVHGRYKQPCPVCGTHVQRIRYAENETNYCPRCQTEGRLLADRALSRLLKDDWPKTIDILESQKRER